MLFLIIRDELQHELNNLRIGRTSFEPTNIAVLCQNIAVYALAEVFLVCFIHFTISD